MLTSMLLYADSFDDVCAAAVHFHLPVPDSVGADWPLDPGLDER